MPSTADCPHCKGKGTLKKTAKAHTDTDGVKVIAWACSACGYSEGR